MTRTQATNVNRPSGRFFVALPVMAVALVLKALSAATRWAWPLRLANDLLTRFVLGAR